MISRHQFIEVSIKALHKWQANKATLRAAALAFFTILPLPSLLLILIGSFALVYGQTEGLRQLLQQVTLLAGPTVANLVSELLAAGASNPLTSNIGSVLTVIFAVFGGIGAFAVLEDSLNAVWGPLPEIQLSFWARIRKRIFPFLAVSFAAVVVVAWTGLTNVLLMSIGYLLGNNASLFLGGIQILLSFALTAILFAIIYKLLPERKIAWGDVALAAFITSLVSTALDYLLGFYIRAFPPTSLAGTAGAIIVLMLWIFITDEFIFFGAQFSRTYAEMVGSYFKEKKPSMPATQT